MKIVLSLDSPLRFIVAWETCRQQVGLSPASRIAFLSVAMS